MIAMHIYQVEDYETMNRQAVNIISTQVIYKPNCVLSLVIGDTPVRFYQ